MKRSRKKKGQYILSKTLKSKRGTKEEKKERQNSFKATHKHKKLLKNWDHMHILTIFLWVPDIRAKIYFGSKIEKDKKWEETRKQKYFSERQFYATGPLVVSYCRSLIAWITKFIFDQEFDQQHREHSARAVRCKKDIFKKIQNQILLINKEEKVGKKNNI